MFVATDPESLPVVVTSPAQVQARFHNIVHMLHARDRLIRDTNHHKLQESASQQILSG
ncbi:MULTISPECIES: hypothetical protein [Mycolicibacter]|uniref:hypothetical protein n=1 Tax=Mycolicibacter TaxID=1073531 RepID=UPI0038B668B2